MIDNIQQIESQYCYFLAQRTQVNHSSNRVTIFLSLHSITQTPVFDNFT